MKYLTCSTCEKDKPVEAFSPRPDTKRGYRSNCKPCERSLCQKAYKVRRKANG